MRTLNLSDELTGANATGSFLVLFDDDEKDPTSKLKELAGLAVASTRDTKEGVLEAGDVAGADGIVFHQLGVAVVDLDRGQMTDLLAPTESQQRVVIEPERFVYAVSTPAGGLSGEYLRGYRDAVDHLLGQTVRAGPLTSTAVAAAWDESQATWGLQATHALDSGFTGKGVRVAVLDTGIDQSHPDFSGRTVTTQSFIAGLTAHDGHGHGTHCVGTACGPAAPAVLPRYGIASEAEIYAGKVLNDLGRGADRGILAGINWAVLNGCQVISMSLGSPIQPGQTFSTVYERAARRAAASGTLIIAAAGNDSRRDLGVVSPVGHPANCPSIMSVAAVDQHGQAAYFSNGGINLNGGQIDVAAPGVNVRSSWPIPKQYNTISGTSMATPHVAGIAALLAEAQGGPSATALRKAVVASVQALGLPTADVGAGMIKAP